LHKLQKPKLRWDIVQTTILFLRTNLIHRLSVHLIFVPPTFLRSLRPVNITASITAYASYYVSATYGRPLSVAWAKSMLCLANVIHLFFFLNGRFMLRPRLTEVRETFTRGGPWLWVEKLLCLDFFLVLLKLQGGSKSNEIWHIFRPRPQTFCSHARTQQNIVILKKNFLSTDGCSIRVLGLVNFGLQTPEIHASYYCSLKLMTWVNSLGHVLF